MQRKQVGVRFGVVMLAVAGLAVQCRAQFSDLGAVQAPSAFSIPRARQIQADELNRILQGGGNKPRILQVGSHVMYSQAHIRGAQYAGPGSQAAGLKLLEGKVERLPKGTVIVIYCGCCPWDRCPNLGPAFHRLDATRVYTGEGALYRE